jgi:hypothetical protein
MKDHQILQKERDLLHKNLVQEACHKNYVRTGNSDGVLQLHRPFYIRVKDEILHLVGIDCEIGYPIVETYAGSFRHTKYSNLTMDELVTLHSDVVMNKLYTFTPEKQLV